MRIGLEFPAKPQTTSVSPGRLNCVVVACARRVRWLLAVSLAPFVTVLCASCPAQSAAQPQSESQKSLVLKPDLPGLGRNHRLILKDGTYQMVRQYQIVGDRVRYLSQERGDWEELPANLVDWDATRKWEQEHANLSGDESSPGMKEAAEVDAEEATARADEKARMPQVAPGLELPDQSGVFVLDTFQGTPELVTLQSNDLDINARSRNGLGMLNPLAGARIRLALQGEHAKVHLHVNDPSFYLSLPAPAGTEPVLSHPITIKTVNPTADDNRVKGAESPSSQFAVVRLDERLAERRLGPVQIGADGKIVQNSNVIPTKVEILAGKRWMRVQVTQKLLIGEYALVEILSPSEMNVSVWDFRVYPVLGDNPGSIGPILDQTSER